MLTIRGLGVVLRDLASVGYDAKWGVLSCKVVGGVHIRERIWVVATDAKVMHCNGGADSRRAVLTWAHLEARIAEIETGKPAGFW